jgi:hypothetical protein
MNTERRRNARLHPKKLTFVAVRPEFSRSGELFNISRSGLCFQYLRMQNPTEDESKSIKIDIFIINNNYYLPKVPCTLIYDVEEKKGPTLFPKDFEFRRCGLKFGEISFEQAQKLGLYLENHTVKEA